MKHIFLFNECSRASMYGIGTYVEQLTTCMSYKTNITMHVVNLYTEEKEFKVIKRKNSFLYFFPEINQISEKQEKYYYRGVWYILNKYISELKTTQLIFHFNCFRDIFILDYLKKEYPTCLTIFTVHYLNWCFALKGNTSYFKNILKNEKLLIGDDYLKKILSTFQLEKQLLKKIDTIICLSKYTQNLLLTEYMIPNYKLKLIYNGLKDEAIILSKEEKGEMKKQLYIPEQDKIILFVGRLESIKGVDIAIKAFKIVLKHNPNIRLILVGDGSFPVCLEQSEECWSRIIFTGKLKKEYLYKFYQIADVGVMPSMHEQCSYVAIEMLMFDIPLLISTTTGLNEMLPYDKYKIHIIEEENDVSISPQLLAKKIMEIMSNDKLEYRTIYKQKYTIKHMFDSMCEIYDKN